MPKKWNKFYRKQGRFYLLPHPDFKKVVDIFKEDKILKIIDIGCGSGRHLIELAENDFLVTGLDYSPIAGHIAEDWLHQKDLKGKVYIGDYEEDLKHFEDESFDAAISVNSLQYVDSIEKLQHILKEIRRILRKNAKFFLVFPSQSTLIIQPNTTQLLLEKHEIEAVISKFFNIHEFYQDQNKAWVIFTSKTDDKQKNLDN
ncbi:methyltransferase domain-containing protein [Candidatus Dojkabacteria bacterium]|nr:methyltransferase domain-containing protein [Candidatus Dojkabacteria bacterium]